MKQNSRNIMRLLLFCLSLAFIIVGIMHNSVTSTGIAMAMAFGDLAFEDEPENMGGMTTVAYLGLSNEIDAWASLKKNPSNATEAVTLVGSFTMKADKKFHQIYVTPDTFSLDSENQGEIDGQSFRQKGEFLYPGTSVEALAFCRKINNARGILIGINPNTGDRLVIGSKDRPCYFKPSMTTGKAAADRRGVKVEFWSDSFVPASIYNGAIPLSDGDIPAIS